MLLRRLAVSRGPLGALRRAFSTVETPVDPQSLDWGSLVFDYVPAKSIVQCHYVDGKWTTGELTGPFLQVHAMSNVLHYGQALFEGLKAFHTADGNVQVFNANENAARMRSGSERLGMPVVPPEVFNAALDQIITDNVDYVPPFGTGGSLYLRPFLFGHGAKLGLGAAPEYTFGVLCSPVGTYYKTGIKPVDSIVVNSYDRAAPRGVGNIKCAGNYAADVVPAADAHAAGYPLACYLDAAENRYIEEFSTSNFIGISADGGSYVTPKSDSILPSITNKMLMQLARDSGLTVEQRPVAFDEVSNFSEVAACGTAVIITPLKSITRGEERVEFAGFNTLKKLHDNVRAIQTGEAEDKHGWCRTVCPKPLP